MLISGLSGSGIFLLKVGCGQIQVAAGILRIGFDGFLEIGNALLKLLLADETLAPQDQAVGILGS